MIRTRIAGAIAGALALGGCYEISTQVPAVTDTSRVADAGVGPGRYCGLDVYFDDAGVQGELAFDECFALSVDGGALTVTPDDPAEQGLTLEVADLSRGARLLQYRNQDEQLQLLVAFLRADAVAVLDEPYLTPSIASAAERLGVELATTADGEEIDILAGESDAVLEFVSDAAGLTFDAALRDEAMALEMKDDAIFYVRVGSDAADADLDLAAAQEKVDALFAMIDRAMALE